MTLVMLVLLALALLILTTFFIVKTMAIRRDMNRRLDEFRDRLEADANSIVDDLLDSSRPHQDGSSRARAQVLTGPCDDEP